jgi:hypothetical protein
LPSLLAIYKSGDPGESSYAPRRPWKPRSQPMYQDPPPQAPPYYQQPQQVELTKLEKWSPQYASHHPWLQGWRGGHTQGNTQIPPIPMPTHPYPQFPPNIQQIFPGFVPPPLPPIPQQPQQFQNVNSPRPTLLPAQSVPNPNNKPTQPLHNVELQTFSTYFISHVSLHEIQLRSWKVLDKQKPSVVIREENEDETPDQPMDDTKWEDVIIPKYQEQKPPQSESLQTTKVPPYPERLEIKKPTIRPEFDIINELKIYMCQNSPVTRNKGYLDL